jgi:hypothetical protein
MKSKNPLKNLALTKHPVLRVNKDKYQVNLLKNIISLIRI